jgi:hypothetical protein
MMPCRMALRARRARSSDIVKTPYVNGMRDVME